MIHLKLGPRRQVTAEDDDPMRREWVGYEPTLGAQTIYEQNRGLWSLGPQADNERYAVFSAPAQGGIACVVELSAIESFGRKRAIVGTVLGPGHPVHDALIGRPAPDSHRNPVTYAEDPAM
jgi:hypothetical protein